MIVAKRTDASNYRGIHPMLDKALDHLNDEFLQAVGKEPVHIDGQKLYAMLNVFETLPDDRLFFEAHRDYLDIHAVLSGEERIDIAYTEALTPDEDTSKPENDLYAYSDTDPEHQSVVLGSGDFLVAFPSDAHRVKGQVCGASQVRKVVFKIKI